MKAKLILWLLMLFGILVPSVLGLQITSPKASVTYLTSIQNLSYTLNITNATGCWYNFGLDNHTLANCANEMVEIPINSGHINLTVFSQNSSVTNHDRVEVWLDNDLSSGKAAVLIAIMALFIVLPFVFWYVCFKLDGLHMPMKMFLTLLGFFSIYVFLHFASVMAENFIHIPVIQDTITSVGDVYIWIFYTIFVYFLVVFIFSSLGSVARRER